MKKFFDSYCKNKRVSDWSIADFVKTTSIEKKDLQSLIESLTVIEYPDETVILNCFDFDYDAIYNGLNHKTDESPKDISFIDKINEDMLFCCQPQLSVDTSELNSPSISDDQNDDSVISDADVSASST